MTLLRVEHKSGNKWKPEISMINERLDLIHSLNQHFTFVLNCFLLRDIIFQEMDCSEGEGLWVPTVFMIYGDNRFQFYTGLQQAQN